MAYDFCESLGVCRICQMREDAPTRKILIEAGLSGADWQCPFPETMQANREALHLRNQGGGDKPAVPAACRFIGAILAPPLQDRPCLGAEIECLNEENPNRSNREGWCKPEKCRFYQAGEADA